MGEPTLSFTTASVPEEHCEMFSVSRIRDFVRADLRVQPIARSLSFIELKVISAKFIPPSPLTIVSTKAIWESLVRILCGVQVIGTSGKHQQIHWLL